MTEPVYPVESPLRSSKFVIRDDDDLVLLRLLMGAEPTMLIVTAAELGLFDELGTEKLTAKELAKRANLDLRATRIVLDGLVGLGLLRKNDDSYHNTPTALRHLRIHTDNGDAIRLWISGTRLWEKLPEILRTGRLPDHLAAHAWRYEQTENRVFSRSMYNFGWLTAQSVAETVDLSDIRHLVDLGGGPGHYAIAMLERYPGLRATVVDLPLTVAVARDTARRHGLEQRIDFVASDLYTESCPLPPSCADVVLLSHVLHMEGPSQNAALIVRASSLLVPGGRLIVHDLFLEENQTDPGSSSMFAVNMLTMTERGEVYTSEDIASWLSKRMF